MKKAASIVSFLATASLYAVIRVPSLLSHYVAYTYDQGRDFIAGASIMLFHKIPFIGPTTGVNGLFHGSWWYYLLSVPYLLFSGQPIGYYWFNFFIQFILLIGLMVFLKKEFGLVVAILFGLLITLSPYFTFMSLFVGNNVMVLPALLTFLICNYYLFQEKRVSPLLLFVTGLSLAFVGEFELSFGIFLIPLYFIAIVIWKDLRKTLFNEKIPYFILGLLLAFTPRILFELKNSFAQTKVLLSFLFHPKLYNSPAPYLSRVSERWILFKGYYFELFNNEYFAYIFLVSILVIAILTGISVVQKKTKIQAVFFFYIYLLGGLFFLATLYKDFFWKNYYEGIHYIFLFICITLIGQHIHKKYLLIKRAFLLSICLGLGIVSILQLTKMHKPPFDGLQVQESVASFILKSQDQNKNYCLRIYTPSVIPHTYDYLFLINKMKPSAEWVNGECWFIVESDSYKKRRNDWLEVHVPKDKHTVEVKTIKDIEVRHYKVLPQ